MKLFKLSVLAAGVTLASGSGLIAVEAAKAITYESCAAGWTAVSSGTVCETTYTSVTPTTFTPPTGVTSIDVLLVGGGGGAGGTGPDPWASGMVASGGGGGGEVKVCTGISVSPSSSVAVSVGAGSAYVSGGAPAMYYANGNSGSPSSFGDCVAQGGLGSPGYASSDFGKGASSGSGNIGGNGNYSGTTSTYSSGGGAGAGGDGGNAYGSLTSPTAAYKGGDGGTGVVPSSLGVAAGLFSTLDTCYGGGGAGSGWNGVNQILSTTSTCGGGAKGSYPFNNSGEDGRGGGGSGAAQGGYGGAVGGSGIIKVRYAALPQLTSTTVALGLSPSQWIEEGTSAGVSANVTASSGSLDPTGTVSWSYCYSALDYPSSCNFSNDTELPGHTADILAGGTAGDGVSTSTIPTLSLPYATGYYLFLAQYSGDSFYSGEWNSASLEISPAELVAPGAPGTPTGTAGDGEVELSWSAPSTGTAPFTYTITSNPAGAFCSVTATTATCTGLTNGTDYTFKVTATNGAGSEDSSFSSVVTPAADNSGNGSGGSGSSGASAAKFKPVSPSADEISVSKGSGSINVGIGYSGSNSYKPSSYTVKVSPGGNSCVIYGASSSCEVIGLKTGVEYTVSVTATNKFGTSSATVLPSKYILTEVGLLGYASKKAITGFAGDSARLTKEFKSTIKKYVNANTDLSAVTCTGYTAGKPVIKSDKALAKARAKAACAYVEKIRPSVSTTTIGKTPGLAWGAANRKVVIRGYSTISQ